MGRSLAKPISYHGTRNKSRFSNDLAVGLVFYQTCRTCTLQKPCTFSIMIIQVCIMICCWDQVNAWCMFLAKDSSALKYSKQWIIWIHHFMQNIFELCSSNYSLRNANNLAHFRPNKTTLGLEVSSLLGCRFGIACRGQSGNCERTRFSQS